MAVNFSLREKDPGWTGGDRGREGHENEEQPLLVNHRWGCLLPLNCAQFSSFTPCFFLPVAAVCTAVRSHFMKCLPQHISQTQRVNPNLRTCLMAAWKVSTKHAWLWGSFLFFFSVSRADIRDLVKTGEAVVLVNECGIDPDPVSRCHSASVSRKLFLYDSLSFFCLNALFLLLFDLKAVALFAQEADVESTPNMKNCKNT